MSTETKATIDAPSRVIPEAPKSTWEIPKLLGLDFDDLFEDDAQMVTGVSWPVLVIEGDVHLKGLVRSQDIAKRLETPHPELYQGHVVVILGNLIVDGPLVVEQYYDLMVEGAVEAHSLHGGSANFVATGPVDIATLVHWRESEEGGLIWGDPINAPLFIRDPYTDVEPSGSFTLVPAYDEERSEAFLQVVRQLSGTHRPVDLDDPDLGLALESIQSGGRFDDLVQQYARKLRLLSGEERAEGVPETARRVEDQWVDGPFDDEGRPNGDMRFWRLDGTLAGTGTYAHGEVHGERVHLHDSGAIAQRYHAIHGVVQGTHVRIYTHEPTQESPRPSDLAETVVRVERDLDGGVLQSIRFTDAQGRSVSHEGRDEPRPDGVPEAAWRDPRDGYWKQGTVKSQDDRMMVGTWTFWTDDGLKVLVCEFDESGQLLRHRSWHTDGSEAFDVDWVARQGRYRVAPEATPARSAPHTLPGNAPNDLLPVLKKPLMPNLHPFFVASGATEVRFVPGHMFNAAQRGYFDVLWFWPSQPSYVDEDGAMVEPAVDGSEGPPLSAHVATRPYNQQPMWRLESDEGEERRTQFWRFDGTRSATLSHTLDGQSFRSLELFDGSGAPTFAARFADLPDGGPRYLDVTLPVGGGAVTLVGDADCALVSSTHTAADGTAQTVTLSELGAMSHAGIQSFYDRFLAPAADHNQVSLRMGEAYVKNIEVTEVDGPLPFTLLGRVDYSRALILVQEGAETNGVYWVEEDDECIAPRDLMNPEALLGVLAQKGVEPSASVDAKVAALFPPANRLAADTASFFGAITMKPHLHESAVFTDYGRSEALTDGSTA